jgi:hypothetical protein
MTLFKFKDIDVANVVISKPEKIDGEYKSKILYGNNETLLIQTPELIVNDFVGGVEFNMVNNGDFFCLLDNLTEKIITYIYTNSKDFFNGKEFSENRIRTSLHKIVDVDTEGIVKLSAVTAGIEFKVINIFNEEIIDYQFPLKGKCILDVSEITYHNKYFIVSLNIKSIKLSPKKLKKGIPVDLDEAEELCEEVDTVEVIEEPEIIEKEIIEIPENVDDLEFF